MEHRFTEENYEKTKEKLINLIQRTNSFTSIVDAQIDAEELLHLLQCSKYDEKKDINVAFQIALNEFEGKIALLHLSFDKREKIALLLNEMKKIIK